MEFLSKDILAIIINQYFFNPYYLMLLSCLNKEFKDFVSYFKEKFQQQLDMSDKMFHFYSFVNDFVNRKDFDQMKFVFRIKEHSKNNCIKLLNSIRFGLLDLTKYFDKKAYFCYTRVNHEMLSCPHFFACKFGRFSIFEYLYNEKSHSCIDLEKSQRFLVSKHPPNEITWDEFEESIPDRIKILEFLKTKLTWFSPDLCTLASGNKSLKMLKYLYENGFPYVKRLCLEENQKSFFKNKEIKQFILNMK